MRILIKAPRWSLQPILEHITHFIGDYTIFRAPPSIITQGESENPLSNPFPVITPTIKFG